MFRLLILLLAIGLQSATAASFVVTSTADTSGSSCGATCTLRQAITAANATATADVIRFVIPGEGPLRIIAASNLPTITQPLTIDGYSQPGALENTLAADASNATIRVWLDAATSLAVPAIGLSICASNVTIRGLAVSGFRTNSIAFGLSDTATACTGATNGVVAGNFIGMDPLGGHTPVQIPPAVLNALTSATLRIGGTAVGDRNVIFGGTSAAVQLGNGASAQIDGNLIGTDPTGSLNRSSGPTGIVAASAATAVIGIQRPNVIAFSAKGVSVLTTATDVSAGPNRFVRVELPVDLGGDGVTPNDPDDVDSGPNGLQNFPVLNLARRSADSLLVQGTLDRPAGTVSLDFSITLYASATCTASGHGPGQRLLGTRSITLANGNNQTFSFTLSAIEPLALGTAITAMATDANGNSSELSACLAVTEHPNVLIVTNTSNSGPGSLVDAIAQANANTDASIIAFNIPGAGPHTIATSGSLAIASPMLIDGYTQPGASRNTLDSGATDAQIRIVIDAANLSGSGSKFFVSAPLTLRGVAIKELGSNVKGVDLIGGSTGSRVQGCFIGTDALGDVTGDASGTGVSVNSASLIGGTLAEHRNLFGGLEGAAALVLAGSSGSVVEGNLFGTSPDGLGVRGNLCSLRITAVASTITAARLGGLLPAEQNLIANDTGFCGAVSVTQTTGSVTGAVIGNAVHSSNTIGIDLFGDRVTLNDVNDVDNGPNGLQNFPELFLAQPVSGLGLRVTGRLDIPTASLNARYRLGFYESVGCDASGHGEGTIYLGSQDVALTDLTTPAMIEAERFVVDLPINTSPGAVVTATATAPDGSTSEFSKCVTVVSADTLMRNGFE